MKIPPIDKKQSSQFQTATFSLGCFWGPDAFFGIIPGIIRTRVGYAGGTTNHPTYTNISDYIETIQMDFDPTMISFSELLTVFWKKHNPTQMPYKRQYISALYFHDKKQEELIKKSLQQISKTFSEKILTEIISFEKFYLAEDYHQKYRLQQIPELKQNFQEIFPTITDFINSTATARVNGYIAGYGNIAQLKNEIDELGLSFSNQELLAAIVKEKKQFF